MNKQLFEIDGIRCFGVREQLPLDMMVKLKTLVCEHFPSAEKFMFSRGIDSYSLACRIHDVSLTLYILDDGMFRYHCTYSELERLKAWMIYGGFCFKVDELADEVKAVKEGLRRRGFIPVEVAV